MPGNITDVNTWTTPIVVPADGDAEGAASVITAFQGLANRTTNVRSGVQGVASALAMRVPLVPVQNPSSIFTNSGGTINGWLQTTTAASALRFMLPYGVLGKIDRVTMQICGGTGAQHSALPATLPQLQFGYFDLTSVFAAATVLATVNDAPANVAAYETPHALATAAGLAAAVGPTREYYVQINGETGANSVASAFRVFALEISFTP